MKEGLGFRSQGLMRTRNIDKKIFFRWLCCFLVLLFFYMLMTGGFFRRWQPLLIIPLAIAVAMFEREVGSALFGAFCGLMIDTACGNLFGMSSVWLMPCALAASLLVMNLIRPNFVNHLWLVTVTCIIMAFMEYFFKYFIWGEPNSNVVLILYIIPSYLSAVVLSPAVYFLIRAIFVKLSEKENGQLFELDNHGENNEST
ncbi:MAG: plasminogen receptor (KT) [Oscillospiraceae bacterium]|nr:plasminogen receptor (KT) [Oscillospiraceae bacterium]